MFKPSRAIDGGTWELLPGGLAESPAEKHTIQNWIKYITVITVFIHTFLFISY